MGHFEPFLFKHGPKIWNAMQKVFLKNETKHKVFCGSQD